MCDNTRYIDAASQLGNAWYIMGVVEQHLKANHRESEVPAVMKRMKSSDYRNLCNVCEEVTNGLIVVTNQDIAA